MNKQEKLNDALPDDKNPQVITVQKGDETFEFTPEDDDVDELIVTGGGGLFVIIDDEEGEDLVYRYPPNTVQEIVYENTGYEELVQEEESEDSEGEESDE